MTTEPTPPPEDQSKEIPQQEVAPAPTPTSGYDPKVVGIVAYLTLIGWIVALIMNNPKSDYGSFHIRQSLGIMLLFLASGIVMIIPFVGWIVGLVGYIAAFVLWNIGLIGATQEKKQPIPLIGEKSQEWFQAL